MNSLRTAILMAGLAAILIALGWYFGGATGGAVAFAVALLLNFGSYWMSDRIVLSMYGAREVTERDAPRLHGIVEEVAIRAGVPKPRVYVIPSDVPNAFATGRDPHHSVVAVTEGILHLLSEDELKGVIAHEVSHIKHRDVLIATIAATVATAITMFAMMVRWAAIFGGLGRDQRGRGGLEILALAILAPIAAVIIQLAISRSREYAADEGAAVTVGNPLSLANALIKLDRYNRAGGGIATPSTAHLFIVHSVRGSLFSSLFSTHPPIEERVRRLRKMAGLQPI